MQNYPKKLLFLKKMQFKVKDIFIPNTDKTIEDHFKNDDVSYFKDKPIQFLINYFNLCIKLGAVSCYKYFKSQGLQPCSDNLEQAIVGRNKEILIDVIENLPQKCFMFTKYEQIRDLELIQLLEKHNQTFDASSTADYYNLPGYLYLLSKKNANLNELMAYCPKFQIPSLIDDISVLAESWRMSKKILLWELLQVKTLVK